MIVSFPIPTHFSFLSGFIVNRFCSGFGGENKKCIELQLHLIEKLIAGTKTFLELLKKVLFHVVT